MGGVICPFRLRHLHRVDKEGDRMKKGVIIAAVFALLVVGWWPADEAAAETLKGRIWAQWAENPDGEVLFGIQYWNTGAPGSGTPGGRTSVQTTETPDGWSAGGAWGFQGDRKSTRLNSSHGYISYAVFCLKKKKY